MEICAGSKNGTKVDVWQQEHQIISSFGAKEDTRRKLQETAGPGKRGERDAHNDFWGKESDGSVEEQTGEDFCEPPYKQRNNSDRILLDVPRNIASTSQVMMTADRHKILSNALNDTIASTITESQGCVEDFVLGQMSTL